MTIVFNVTYGPFTFNREHVDGTVVPNVLERTVRDLAVGLAKCGHTPVVFANTEDDLSDGFDGVFYLHKEMMEGFVAGNTIDAWVDVANIQGVLPPDIYRGPVYAWHNMPVPYPQAYVERVSRWVTPSIWQRDQFYRSGMRAANLALIPFGVDLTLVPDVPKEPKTVACYASADTGLHHFRRILTLLDDGWQLRVVASPDWVTALRYHHNTIGDRARNVVGLVQTPNVTVAVSEQSYRKALATTSVFAMPYDPLGGSDPFGLPILDALVSGCRVVTTPTDSYPSQWGGFVTFLPPITTDASLHRWVDAIHEEAPPPDVTDIRARYAMSEVVKAWEVLLGG
jgi:hypothetical protein